jgi:hypothetical protein
MAWTAALCGISEISTNTRMHIQIHKLEPQSGIFPQAIIWVAGIALTLFCAVGIAAIMGWIPNSLVVGDKSAGGQASAVVVPSMRPTVAKVHSAVTPPPAPAAQIVPVPSLVATP